MSRSCLGSVILQSTTHVMYMHLVHDLVIIHSVYMHVETLGVKEEPRFSQVKACATRVDYRP